MSALFLSLVSCAFARQAPGSILPNGNFETLDAQGNPIGWEMRAVNTKIVAEKNGNHYLVSDPKSPDALPWASTTVSIPPGPGRLRVTARMRVRNLQPGKESWQTARIGMRYEDKEGKLLGYPETPQARADMPWTTLSAESEIPTGAHHVDVDVGNFGASGEVAFDDIEIALVQAAAPPPAAASFSVAPTADATLPPGERLYWGEEPVEKLSSKRAQVVLNGLWKFQPGVAGAKEPASVGWGYLRVPGSWRTGYSTIAIPQMVSPGSGPMWEPWQKDALDQGWYERTLRIPTDWQGRAIVLNFARISTDAWVYIDGKEAGRVAWPAGDVDLTRFVTPGREHSLRVFVATISSTEQVGVFMGPGAGQVSFVDAKPESKGIIDDVTLNARPSTTFISDVFVQPSTRKKQVTLDVELTKVPQTGPVKITARMERNGKVEKTFEQTVNVTAKAVQTVRVAWPWAQAARWDLDTPNLYTVKLKVEGAGLNDEYAQEFGFREFWIQGRQIFLNGIPIRLRPQTMPQEYSAVSGTREYVEGAIKGLRTSGFNIAEMWPGGSERRGQNSFHRVFYDAADRLGFPIMGSAGNIGDFIGWGQSGWKSPQAKAEWERLTRRELRLYRNHPSILIWASSGNSFGNGHDQNPLFVGRNIGQSAMKVNSGDIERAKTMEGALAFMRREDPTRGVFVHQGILGDMYAVNSYMNFMPLQESEEWLSDWARHGTKPYLPIEFGAPFPTSFMRGREHFGQAEETEPFLSEFSAIYLGPQAYRMETPEYRRTMREKFKSGQLYASWHGEQTRDYSPAHMTLLPTFTERIWRSWRTLGTTAGMVPWSGGYAWRRTATAEETDAPPFRPGRRGTYSPKLSKALLLSNQPQGGFELTPAGRALVENNNETLAYIGGKSSSKDIAAVTDKRHAFWSGEAVEKTVVLLNDTRKPQAYSLSWTAKIGGKTVASGGKRGTIAVTQNLFVPFTFNTPAGVQRKGDGVLELTAKIGGRSHRDRFAFRVWPRPRKTLGNAVVTVFDPKGHTTAMLRSLGFPVRAWDGRATKDLLIVGRDALSSGSKPPSDLNTFARNGGRVLVMEQNPEWMERVWGFRVSRHVSRYVFPVDGAHSVVAGLDTFDLRDWAGASAERPPHEPLPTKVEEPAYGWHWGNRGGVSSAAVEKPHLAGWRPLLECEFDGAYSPLMELDLGRGRATLCLLDLEERFSAGKELLPLEPAVERLARQLIRHAQTAPLVPRVQSVALIGTAPSWFEMLGVQCDKAVSLPSDAGLVVIAPDANVEEAALTDYVQRGGKVVFLPRQSSIGAMGVALVQKASVGSLDVPRWTIAAGLSPSDLRWRNETSAWLLQNTNASPGWQTAADGQMAVRKVGKGVAVWLQLDPERFEADTKTYFRFTRWRQTRAIAQVFANLGATLRDDTNALSLIPQAPVIVPLAGKWQYAITLSRPSATGPEQLKDTGISDEARSLLDGSRAMTAEMEVPGAVPGFDRADGEAVGRLVLNIPESYAGKDLMLDLGKVDDFDQTFWNGQPIGSTGTETASSWTVQRRYTVPGRLVKAGRNVLAVRLWDWYGGGGFYSLASEMTLRPTDGKEALLYHSDYRTDFITGDDPFRYKRW
jgi:beta-galactosidase